MWSEWCTTWRECACDCVPLLLLPLPLHSACSSLPSCCTAFYGTVGPDHCCCWCSIYLPLPFQNAGRDTRDCRFWSLEQRINCWGTRAASDVVWHAEFFQWFGFYCYVFLFSPLYLSNLFFPPVHPTTIPIPLLLHAGRTYCTVTISEHISCYVDALCYVEICRGRSERAISICGVDFYLI